MFWYYTWAFAEKTLSFLPGGKHIYSAVGKIVKRNRLGTEQSYTSFPLVRKAKDLIPAGGSVLEVGTGWFHHDAFLMYLVGDYKVFLFDLEDKARLNYIKNYLASLLSNIDAIAAKLEIDPVPASDKLRELLHLPDRESIYSRCNFVPCIVSRPDYLFLPENSIDFMLSRCVLGHIRPEILVDELVILRRMLKDNGYMYHLIGHDDHWAFHDRSIEWPSFNYLRYSERTYGLLFDTKMEYHNRLVKPEWLQIFDRCDLHVEEYNARITEISRQNVRALPRIDGRFAKYPLDDIAIIYSYVLLRKATSAIRYID